MDANDIIMLSFGIIGITLIALALLYLPPLVIPLFYKLLDKICKKK